MPSDLTLLELSRPAGLALLLLFAVLATLLLRRLAPAPFAALGPGRIAGGYAAVAAAVAALALMEAVSQGRAQLAQGLLDADRLGAWLAHCFLYLAGLMLAAALPLLAALVVPAAVWLAGKRRATLPALVAGGLAMAAAGAALHAALPSGAWERAHRLDAVLAFMSPVGIGVVLLPLVFGMGCRLPLRR
jgi:hypothetical protein